MSAAEDAPGSAPGSGRLGGAGAEGDPALLVVVGRSAGGIGAHVADLVAGLAARGLAVRVLTAEATARRFDLGERVVLAWPSRGRRAPADLARVRRELAASGVAHAHGHQAGLLAVLLARTLPRRRRPAVVVSWHNAVLARAPRRWLLALAEAAQARGADLVTGASEDLVARAEALGARARLAPVASPAAVRLAAGRRVADAGGRAAARAQAAPRLGLDAGPDAGPDAERPWLLAVGRIAPQKDLPTLVRAAAATPVLARGAWAGRRPLWLHVGGGDERDAAALRRLVDATGAPVRLLGPLADPAPLLALADAFVLPSTWEARSLAVQEALAAGLPVVAAAVGGLPGLVRDAGVLVPPGRPDALAAAVRALLEDDVRRARLGARAVEVFATLPAPEQVLQRWLSTYEELARAPRGADRHRGGPARWYRGSPWSHGRRHGHQHSSAGRR
ncbi:glycosyltransferase family 4 protein [Quadrisphaera sp. DSM 44207]|uniref:glycosyltransferase family 4 protein n=1 Tax=Quadrisphaera sp. DSM 44207 TaxID=1881057 RepID=UPI000887E561|nr:glycosyltransferase family 4 protein [Quadrisphaera sp. DSM 44207]SDQ51046.1 Glycosyltransferase involved in cell wall bisynthesis [Quadrisphaera sp. DSM 44207]